MRPPHILILRGGAIGDFILTLPVLQLLRQRWPDGRIEVVGYPHVTALALAGGLADSTRSMHGAEIARLFSERAELPDDQVEYIRRFDFIISLLYDPGGTLRRNLCDAGARQVICGTPMVKRMHAVQQLAQPLEALAIYPEWDTVPRLELNQARRQAGRLRCARYGERLLAIHPGSGSPAKNWPLDHFLALTRAVGADGGMTPVFLLGEADTAIQRRLQQSGCSVPVVSDCSLVEVAELLSACQAFVGNDSGITHLAAALGLPTVALFGASDPALWAPLGPHVELVHAPAALQAITLERVLDALHAAVAWVEKKRGGSAATRDDQ